MGFLRRWWWVVVIVLVVAFRGALPEILRSQIETRASEALGAAVRVGDVDLGLLSGHVALEDVTLRATDARPEDESLVAWKRFGVTLRWLPFFRKTIRFAAIELVEPHVALDRLQTGDINLAALVPKSDASEEEAEPSGWKLGIDYFGLLRGGVRFRDFLIPGAEPLALSLESIELRDIALEPEVYGGPSGLKFVARFEGGAVRTRARLVPGSEGIGLDVTMSATKMPLHRSRVYVPGVAWSDLKGLVSFGLRYRLEPGGRNDLGGRVDLDDLTVFVGGLEEPALAWKRLAVELGRIDLAGHDARITSVDLDGVVLPVRPKGPEVLPVLAAARAAKAAADNAPAEEKAEAKKEDAEPATPWTWSIASIALTNGRTRLLADAGPLEVGTTAQVKDIGDPETHPAPVTVGLTVGEGSLDVVGELRRSPLGFAGRVTSRGLDVPKLVDAVQALPPQILQVAKLDAELDVALGSSAPVAGDVRVSGTTTVSDLWIAATDAKDFATGAKRIGVAVTEVTVPGALAASPPKDRPLAVTLGPIVVDQLYARINRTADGVMLPSFAPESPAAAEKPRQGEATPGAPAPRVTIERVTLAKSRVDVVDRTVKPFYWNALDPIDVDLERVRLPDLEIGTVKAHVVSNKKGTIDVTGGFTSKSQLEVVVKNLALSPFNPYVTSLSPYSVSRGALFVTVKAAKDGPSYDTTTWVTLSDFDLASRSGQHVVLESLGIPLTVAIALLRDWRGNIDLTIPVQVNEKGTEVALGSLVGQALVKALVGTLASPLKLVGAVLPIGGSGGGSLAPQPIRFPAGTSVLGEAGTEQIEQLATFLASRPGLGVTLDAAPTAADVRGLREQALLERLGPRTGVIGTFRSVGARGRIVDALSARAAGQESVLEPDDQTALDEYLADVPAPSPEKLRALAEARLKVVEGTLRESYGIGEGQMMRATSEAPEPAEGEPAVRVELGSARG